MPCCAPLWFCEGSPRCLSGFLGSTGPSLVLPRRPPPSRTPQSQSATTCSFKWRQWSYYVNRVKDNCSQVASHFGPPATTVKLPVKFGLPATACNCLQHRTTVLNSDWSRRICLQLPATACNCLQLDFAVKIRKSFLSVSVKRVPVNDWESLNACRPQNLGTCRILLRLEKLAAVDDLKRRLPQPNNNDNDRLTHRLGCQSRTGAHRPRACRPIQADWAWPSLAPHAMLGAVLRQ